MSLSVQTLISANMTVNHCVNYYLALISRYPLFYYCYFCNRPVAPLLTVIFSFVL